MKKDFFNYISSVWMDLSLSRYESIVNEIFKNYKENTKEYDDSAINQIMLAIGFNIKNAEIVDFMFSENVINKNYSYRYFALNKVLEKYDVENKNMDFFWSILKNKECFNFVPKEYNAFINGVISALEQNDCYEEINTLFKFDDKIIRKDTLQILFENKNLTYFVAFESDIKLRNEFNSYLLKNREKIKKVFMPILLKNVDFDNFVNQVEDYLKKNKIFKKLKKSLKDENKVEKSSFKI